MNIRTTLGEGVITVGLFLITTPHLNCYDRISNIRPTDSAETSISAVLFPKFFLRSGEDERCCIS